MGIGKKILLSYKTMTLQLILKLNTKKRLLFETCLKWEIEYGCMRGLTFKFDVKNKIQNILLKHTNQN